VTWRRCCPAAHGQVIDVLASGRRVSAPPRLPHAGAADAHGDADRGGAAFPNLEHKAPSATFGAASIPAAGQRLTAGRIVTLLHRCGRRNDQSVVEHILTDLGAAAVRQPEPVEAPHCFTARGMIRSGR
jgi:hypothetical protein